MTSDTKRCTACDAVKPLEEFNLHVHGRMGRASKCKECNSEYFRKRNEERRRPSKVIVVNGLLSWKPPTMWGEES